MQYLNIIVSFLLGRVVQAEWCVNGFDAPYAVQPWEDFENCETEAASGLSKCWRSTLLGDKTLLQGCRKACTHCEASGADVCDEASWPDKDHGIVCGECKVLVNKFEDRYRTCAGYCLSLGLPCSGAWEEWEDTCTVKHAMTCDQPVSSSDAICECLPFSSLAAVAPTTSQAGLRGGSAMGGDAANDSTDAGVTDGSSHFVVSVIAGSCLVACLLCLSMCMFFRWKQAARTLQKRTDNDINQSGGSSAQTTHGVVLGNPIDHSKVVVCGGSGEKDADPGNFIVVGNPVNIGCNPIMAAAAAAAAAIPLSGGSEGR